MKLKNQIFMWHGEFLVYVASIIDFNELGSFIMNGNFAV